MLDQLTKLVKDNIGALGGDGVPDNKTSETSTVVSHSIIDTLKNAVGSGNFKDVLGMFSGNKNPSETETGRQIQQNTASELSQKLGMDANRSNDIAGSIVPNVLKNMVNKTNDPNDSSFNLQDMLGHITGGKSRGFNIQDLMNKYKSGAFDKDGDGDTDLQDVMQMFKGGGGITDKLKNLF